MHESFLAHRGLRYLWVSAILLSLSILAYLWHDPIPRPNGGPGSATPWAPSPPS